jgi:hypothetical protein
MTATYQLNPSDFTPDFFNALKQMLAGKSAEIKVKCLTEGEYYDKDGLLVREGYHIPKGEENNPFYCAENLRWVNQGIQDAEQEKFVRTFTHDEWEAFVKEQELESELC